MPLKCSHRYATFENSQRTRAILPIITARQHGVSGSGVTERPGQAGWGGDRTGQRPERARTPGSTSLQGFSGVGFAIVEQEAWATPRSTGKNLPECLRSARGWRKEVLCRDVCLLGVKRSLNVPFTAGLPGVQEGTGRVSETGLWRVALLDLCDHRRSCHRAAPTASPGKARSGSELGKADPG